MLCTSSRHKIEIARGFHFGEEDIQIRELIDGFVKSKLFQLNNSESLLFKAIQCANA